MGSQAGIALIPWDPVSSGHVHRMTTQRHACGWNAELVPHWQEKVVAGEKILFWIVLGRGVMEDALLVKHTTECSAEREPLQDTAAQVGKTKRTATGEAFVPIGHIALDEYPARNKLFGVPAATLWIKSFYISRALQLSGLGRQAMTRVEAMAAGAPFRSAALALDTTHPAWQRQSQSRRLYGTEEPPAGAPPIHTNQAWYARQDYVDMVLPEVKEKECARTEGRDSLGYYRDTDRETGKEVRIPTVYMYKMIDS